MLSATLIPEERTQLMETLSRVPRSVVIDHTAVADLLLDLLGPGEPPRPTKGPRWATPGR